MAKNNNLVDFTVDFTELAEFTGFIDGYTTALDSQAFKKALVDATYNGMTQAFDDWMSLWAVANKPRFTHVYEFSVHGDPYRLVGDKRHKLWKHVMQPGGGGSVLASFTFLPAKQRVPTYRQRRNSSVGDDPIRHIEEADFRKLLDKTHNRRWTFIWKAPMNEYGIARHIRPVERKWLFLPNKGFEKPMSGAAGAGWRFTKSYTITQDPPGNSFGAFTAAWTMFWRKGMSPHQFDSMVGDRAAKIVEDGLEEANNVTKKSRKVSVSITSQTDYAAALAAGKAKARRAMGATQERLDRINQESEWKIYPGGGLSG